MGEISSGDSCFFISFVSLFSFIPYILFLFQNSLLSDFSVEFAWFAIAFQYSGTGDGLAGTVVEIYLLEALA